MAGFQGFQGFDFTPSEEIKSEFQAGLQRALTSGNKDAMRAANMQQIAFTLSGGTPEFRAAKKREKVLRDAREETKTTGDQLQDQIEYFNKVHAAAAAEGLEDVALQARQNILQLSEVQMQRKRIRIQDEQTAEKHSADIDNLAARTDKTVKELETVGKTEFGRNIADKDRVQEALNDPTLTPKQREQLQKNLGFLQAKLIKDSTIVGRTEGDMRSDPAAARATFKTLSDNQVLLNNIDLSLEELANLDPFEGTKIASFSKDFIGFMEGTFARKPSETEQAFVERVQEREGKPAIIAAKVRHALTGAQMSAFEIVYLEPFLPSPSDPISKQIAKLKIVRAYTQLDSDTRLAMFNEGLTGRYFGTPNPEAQRDASDGNPLKSLDDAIKAAGG